MKTSNYLIIGLFGLLILGCKKSFLELAPVSNSNTNNFYTSISDFDLAVNNAYSTLQNIYGPNGVMSFTGELMSDNTTLYQVASSGPVSIADRWAFRDYSINASNNQVSQFWSDMYTSLYSINVILQKIELVDLGDAYEKQVISEMRFLRALYYFDMVRIWGDVPLITTPVSSTEAFAMARTSKAEVYNQIIADLTFAGSNLTAPNRVPQPGRASDGAAKTLLGEVYLTMGNKAAAATVLREVYNAYNGTIYDLLANYGSLWGASASNKNTKESIFEVQYKAGSNNPGSIYWPAFAPFENFAITTYGGGINQVTDDLYNEYETGDVRRDTSIEKGYFKGGVFIATKFQKKFKDAAAPIINGAESANNNFMVLRYADLLLMLSEATADPQYLNKVRARVNLPLYGSAGYPSVKYPTLDLAIEHERRVELAIEFHRWFDLKRTNRAVAVLTAKGKPVNDNKLLLPVPQSARDQNSNLTQNSGY